jgi:hypothetical protein
MRSALPPLPPPPVLSRRRPGTADIMLTLALPSRCSKTKDPAKTAPKRGFKKVGGTGLEPVTPSLSTLSSVRVSSLMFAQRAWLSGIPSPRERWSERERTPSIAIVATRLRCVRHSTAAKVDHDHTREDHPSIRCLTARREWATDSSCRRSARAPRPRRLSSSSSSASSRSDDRGSLGGRAGAGRGVAGPRRSSSAWARRTVRPRRDV